MHQDKIIEIGWREGRRREVFFPTFGDKIKTSLNRQQENQKKLSNILFKMKTTRNQDDTKHKQTLFAAFYRNTFLRVCNKENEHSLSNNWGLR